MAEPRVTRPHFPKGYIEDAKSLVSWEYVIRRLGEAKNYWLCTVRPDGRPHAVPKWGVWVDEKIYFDGSPATRHARNIAANPHVSLHLESGDEVVIVEGLSGAVEKPARELASRIAQAYALKYASLGYSPQADQWDGGGLFQITPHAVLAWTQFTKDPTKFILEGGSRPDE